MTKTQNRHCAPNIYQMLTAFIWRKKKQGGKKPVLPGLVGRRIDFFENEIKKSLAYARTLKKIKNNGICWPRGHGTLKSFSKFCRAY